MPCFLLMDCNGIAHRQSWANYSSGYDLRYMFTSLVLLVELQIIYRSPYCWWCLSHLWTCDKVLSNWSQHLMKLIFDACSTLILYRVMQQSLHKLFGLVMICPVAEAGKQAWWKYMTIKDGKHEGLSDTNHLAKLQWSVLMV